MPATRQTFRRDVAELDYVGKGSEPRRESTLALRWPPTFTWIQLPIDAHPRPRPSDWLHRNALTQPGVLAQVHGNALTGPCLTSRDRSSAWRCRNPERPSVTACKRVAVRILGELTQPSVTQRELAPVAGPVGVRAFRCALPALERSTSLPVYASKSESISMQAFHRHSESISVQPVSWTACPRLRTHSASCR